MRWVWPVGAALALLVCLLALAGAGAAQAQQGPPVLPVCPETRPSYRLFPSPFFDEDQTLFWVYVDPIERTGVLRSTDNGRTWLEVLSYSVQRGNPRITQFDIASMRSGSGLALYAVVMEVFWDPDAFHFFTSENSGSTWQEGSSPCAGLDCYDYSLRAASRPGVLFQPRTWYTSVGGSLPEGVARSVDHGATWQQVWGQTPVAQVAISPNFDQDETLVGVLPYDGITNSNIIISHDAGETWRLGGDGLCPAYWVPQLTISPGFARDRTSLLSSDRSSLFMSEDGGLTWRAIFPPGGPFCDTSTEYGLAYVAFSPDYPDDPTIYAATYQGLYASYDAGRSWILLVRNSSSDLTVRRALNAGRAPAERTTQGDVRMTEDGHRVFLPLAAIQGSGPPYKPHTLFMRAQITGSYNGAHYRSDDGGRTWQCMTPPEVRTRAYLPLLRIRS
jgi:photosystem II stability/assembly factor-like uncharacterized protein